MQTAMQAMHFEMIFVSLLLVSSSMTNRSDKQCHSFGQVLNYSSNISQFLLHLSICSVEHRTPEEWSQTCKQPVQYCRYRIHFLIRFSICFSIRLNLGYLGPAIKKCNCECNHSDDSCDQACFLQEA